MSAGIVASNGICRQALAAEAAPPTTETLLATYTFWLATATVALVLATLGLVLVAYRQFVDSRLNNRAYVSVEPKGLSPWRGTPNQFLAHMSVRNAGVMPARNLTWLFHIEMDNNGDRQVFPVGAQRRGSQLVVGHSAMSRGTPPTTQTGADYCFAWGVVEYDDGYGVRRTTTFCHRYNCNRADFRQTLSIPELDARQHEFGNSAN
jgi:hypothetical protein